MSRIVMVVAHENFRDEELFHTYKELQEHEVKIASTELGEAKGMLGGTANIDLTINEVDDSFDSIVFVGGSGASVYYENKKALELAKNYFEAGKIVAAICIAPGILARAGILKGKKATMWGDGKDIVEHGGTFTNEPVTVDGKIITANGPSSAIEFGRTIAGFL